VPEFIDTVVGEKSPKRSFSVMQNERFGFVFRESWVYKSEQSLLSNTQGNRETKMEGLFPGFPLNKLFFEGPA
jgi:hypothetical protein